MSFATWFRWRRLCRARSAITVIGPGLVDTCRDCLCSFPRASGDERWHPCSCPVHRHGDLARLPMVSSATLRFPGRAEGAFNGWAFLCARQSSLYSAVFLCLRIRLSLRIHSASVYSSFSQLKRQYGEPSPLRSCIGSRASPISCSTFNRS